MNSLKVSQSESSEGIKGENDLLGSESRLRKVAPRKKFLILTGWKRMHSSLYNSKFD